MQHTIEQVAAIRAQLWDAGFRPLAVFNHDHADPKLAGKAPLGRDWGVRARQDPPECLLFPPVSHALNTGILCDGLRAIDIDVDDPEVASRCRSIVVHRFGEAPIRMRGNSPRCLILYRAADGEPGKISIAGELGKIEVLGKGQQFVAFGKHPTGVDLTWFPDPPGEETLDNLQPVDEQSVFDALTALAPIIKAPLPTRTNGNDHQAGEPEADSLRVAAALHAIPNNAPANWEFWNKIGMAVWRATGGSEFGWEAFNAWSSRHPNYDRQETFDRWHHFFDSPPDRVGAGTIFHLARLAREELQQADIGTPPEEHDDPGYWQSVEMDAHTEPAPPEEPPALVEANETVFDPWNTLRPVHFPVECLPPALREFILRRAKIIGADPCAIAWSCISACSAAIDGRVRLQMKRHDAWTVPPAVWVALIGAPSTKKTPVMDAAWAPLHRVQTRDLHNHQLQLAHWKAQPKNERGDEPPGPRRLISHDATMEALQDLLSKQERGIGVLRDELAGWVGAMEKYAPGKGGAADRAFALQSYNGGSHVVDRVGRGTLPIANLLATLCGGIQPDRLLKFGDLTDDGLWQRFVPIIVGPASIGVDEAAGPDDQEYHSLIERLLKVPSTIKLQLSEEAHAVRESVQRRIFHLEQSEVLGSRFVGFCGKLVGLWGRLCLVLHFMVNKDTNTVSERTAMAAQTLLFRSVLPNAARVYTAMGGAGGDLEATQSIAGYILTKRLARIVMSDLTSNVRVCRHRSQDEVRKLLSPLSAGGWLEAEKEFNCTAWNVRPEVHSRFTDRAAKESRRREAVRALITATLGDGVEE